MSNISQPAFSRRIKALESWVGTRLVERSSHPVELTAAGQQILEAGIQAIARIEDERKHINEAMTEPDKCVVTFATQHSIGWRFFLSWMQAFEEAFGSVLSRLHADNLPNCVDDLVNGHADFVISYGSEYSQGIPALKSLESLNIGRDRLLPVCKPTSENQPMYPLDASNRVVPYLGFSSEAPINQHIAPLLAHSGLEPKLNLIYENWMVGALRLRAQEGEGVAWLPQSLVQTDIDAGRLTVTGSQALHIELDIRLHRIRSQTNVLTNKIWSFLVDREGQLLTGRA